MIQAIEELLLHEWGSFGLPPPHPGRLLFIQICSTWLADAGRIVFLVFRPGDGSPCAVARIIRSELHKDILIDEHASLFAVHAANPGLRESVPYPLFCDVLDGKMIRIETALEGTPLTILATQSGNKTRQRIVLKAYADLGKWLIEFGHSLRALCPTWDSDELRGRFRESIRQFGQHFELDSAEQEYLIWLQRELDRVMEIRVPVTPNHGDLAAGAVLVQSNGVGVIDWEYYNAEGLPLFDHFMTVVQTGFSLDSPKTLTLLDQFKLSFAQNWYSEMASQWLQVACHQFGLPESFLATWFSLFLIEMTNSRDWTQQAAAKHGEGSWRELFAYYVHHRSTCYLTGEAR